VLGLQCFALVDIGHECGFCDRASQDHYDWPGTWPQPSVVAIGGSPESGVSIGLALCLGRSAGRIYVVTKNDFPTIDRVERRRTSAKTSQQNA
jgi:hypothetical protein